MSTETGETDHINAGYDKKDCLTAQGMLLSVFI